MDNKDILLYIFFFSDIIMYELILTVRLVNAEVHPNGSKRNFHGAEYRRFSEMSVAKNTLVFQWLPLLFNAAL